MRNHLLAYDVDCGPCRRFKEIVDFMDPKERIAFLSLNEADDLGLLERVPRPKRHTSFHLIFSDGGVKSGAEAIPSVIRLFPMGVLFSKGLLAPGGRRMVAGVYSIFSRLHDSGSCRYQSALAARRAGQCERFGALPFGPSSLNWPAVNSCSRCVLPQQNRPC